MENVASPSVPAADSNAEPWIVDLAQLDHQAVALAGGKGANLGELIRAGFPVPPGFVLTTAAYEEFVARNSLSEAITRALAGPPPIDGAPLRAAFEAAPIPATVEQACRAAYQGLGRGAVAVRSSATAEDLPGAAFAGQQETFLNIMGEGALLDAVRRCWASLWTDRAIAYRARLGIDQHTISLAVVVQRLVEAGVAGVLFTANPVTGDRREMVIDASPGLGEAVVSGLATPDHYVLRRIWRGWQVRERQLGRREVVVRTRAGGGTEQVVAADRAPAPAPVLTDQALLRIARLGAAIERHFGAPQDVEWARRDGQVSVLQARPITALPAELPRWLPPPATGTATELLSVRPYPFDLAVWLPAVVQAITPLLEPLGLATAGKSVFVEEDGVVVGLSGRLPLRLTAGVLLAPLRLGRLVRDYDPLRWQTDRALLASMQQAAVLDRLDVSALSWEELLEALTCALALPRTLAGDVRRRYFPRAVLALGLLRILVQFAGYGRSVGALLSGVETQTLAANRALDELAAEVRRNPLLAGLFAGCDAGTLWAALEAQPAGQAWLEKLRAFLARYGHREALITTAALPTWREAPEIVLGIIKGLALDAPRPSVERPAWQHACDQVMASPRVRAPARRSAFLGLLRTARCLTQIREDTHFHAILALPIVRRIALELGRRLVEVGALDSPDAIFHLTRDDLERPCGSWPPPPEVIHEISARAARRRGRRAAMEGLPLINLGGQRTASNGADVLLRGTPGSPGVAQGPVRVIHAPAEFGALKPGEILVAPYTNPAWTPLFRIALALVVDTGGAASHAAIVAREYGIPAVMGAAGGTRRLVDGQHVSVDGTRGIVRAA